MLKRSSAVDAPFKPLKINKVGNDNISYQTKTESPKEIKSQPILIESKTDNCVVSVVDGENFNILYRKFTAKKNKTWEGDGYLSWKNGIVSVRTLNNKSLGKKQLPGIEIGQTISMNGYEVYIDSKAEKMELEPVKRPDAKAPVKVHLKTKTSLKKTIKKAIIGQSNDDTSSNTSQLTIDPMLDRFLRSHQVSGVQFLYECIMGIKDDCVKGALLADDMGLGKSLTTITLIWTLLKQKSPTTNSAVIKRALIVCPVTLVSNWKKEFNKWLGKDRIGIYILDSKSKVRDFTSNSVYQVMITGYERIRSMADELHDANFDIVVCDEGHRLKTATNMSAQAINSLNIDKKIVLTGTPIQNDLGEFYIMADFLNPGILGTYANFKREFEIPIMRSRQPGASETVTQKGQDQMELLSQTTKKFVLRRSAKEIMGYLPPKSEIVLFCNPTRHQIGLYEQLLESTDITMALESMDTSDHLKAITLLKKACNSTSLIEQENQSLNRNVSKQSGKLLVLHKLLKNIFNDTDEKVVIVSGYTQTLDIIQQLISSIPGNPHFLRLDGATPQKRRQTMVDEFNRTSSKECFAFFLSAKSGGTGLNLVGASRLILFDADWNPAVDLQAMARIHRDGQTRPVFIYRLLTTGCIDEKIFQRQITKQGLAERLMSDQNTGSAQLTDASTGSASDTFTMTELRDLFTLQKETSSNTHDLLDCRCYSSMEYNAIEAFSDIESSDNENNDLGGWVSASDVALGSVRVPRKLKAKERLKGLFQYKHIHPTRTDELQNDGILLKVVNANAISMIFWRMTDAPHNCDEPQNQQSRVTEEKDLD